MRLRSFLVLPLFAGCAVGPDAEVDTTAPPSFEAFEAATYREPWEGGLYIIDGDMPVLDRKALFEVWSRRQPGALIVHQNGGLDARWNEQAKRALTYCVSDAFGSNKAAVVAAMAGATDAGWEQFADVDFVHLPAEDATCDGLNPNVVFDVRPVSGQPYLARAFFPNDPREARNILIDAAAFDTIWTLTNILGHETGHALGFRHEHTRPEGSIFCYEDDQWRALTAYDSASVMHYPQCNGTGTDLSFTALDAEGAAALYGAPGGGPGPDPDPAPVTEYTEAGTVAGGEWRVLPAFEVEPGSLFEVVMTGTGDADLYVRFGAAPTKSEYDCRPFTGAADETCAIDVPADQTTAYVAIQGFEPATFDVTVRYVERAEPALLVINEILADPSHFDGNGDGVIHTIQDEMVEIVNVGGSPADLSGATIADAFGVRVHVAAGTVIEPGEVLVVFGGGVAAPLGDGVHVQIGRLYLNNDEDAVTLRDAAGVVLASATYGANAGQNASVVRSPELDPAAPFVVHSTVSPERASPGRRVDGLPF